MCGGYGNTDTDTDTDTDTNKRGASNQSDEYFVVGDTNKQEEDVLQRLDTAQLSEEEEEIRPPRIDSDDVVKDVSSDVEAFNDEGGDDNNEDKERAEATEANDSGAKFGREDAVGGLMKKKQRRKQK